MLEELTQHISQLKNLVSLRYVDPPMRELCIHTINSLLQENKSLLVCEEYIMKIEHSHEKMMTEVSQFLDRLTPAINDCHTHLEHLQHEIACSNKVHQLELEEHQSHQAFLNDRLEKLTEQLQAKEEEIRELTSRLDEREALMEVHEKEEREYLNKIQTDFEKQQKALQEAVFLIARRDDELKRLQGELSILQQPRIHLQAPEDMVNISQDEEEDYQEPELQTSQHANRSENSYSLVQCSFMSSPDRSEGLQQFEQLKVENRLEEVLVSQEMEGIGAPQTLREMLNLSLEKQYKLLYNKCDSVEGNTKQNFQRNWQKQSKSKSNERKMQWGVNQSLELLERKQVKEFKLPAGIVPKHNNPYYNYFLIASQNVKIRSQHFQMFSNVSTEDEWKNLWQRKVPLHEWESQIEKYLITVCKIGQ